MIPKNTKVYQRIPKIPIKKKMKKKKKIQIKKRVKTYSILQSRSSIFPTSPPPLKNRSTENLKMYLYPVKNTNVSQTDSAEI